MAPLRRVTGSTAAERSTRRPLRYPDKCGMPAAMDAAVDAALRAAAYVYDRDWVTHNRRADEKPRAAVGVWIGEWPLHRHAGAGGSGEPTRPASGAPGVRSERGCVTARDVAGIRDAPTAATRV